jgi:hypothetical protein
MIRNFIHCVANSEEYTLLTLDGIAIWEGPTQRLPGYNKSPVTS